jgi:hypothetical protein
MFRRLSYGLVVMALFAVHSVVAEEATVVKPLSGGIINIIFENDAYDLLRRIHRSKEYEVYPVVDRQVFSERVLKANEIVFQPGGNLIFSNIDGDHLAIIANKIKFSGTADSDVYMISRMESSLEDGKDGNRGRNGDSPCCNGVHGGDGKEGASGEDGKHPYLPDLYVFANEIVWEAENTVGKIRTTFVFPGLNGSNGGHGGRGGNGGNGGAGRGGDSSWRKCNRQPGPGGNGGNAGIGGGPGNGGDAGNGSNIYFIGPRDVLDVFSFSTFQIDAGLPGKGGMRGQSGDPGGGGRAGHRTGFCTSKKPRGRTGSTPPNSHPGIGVVGDSGHRGQVYMIEVKGISELLN